MLSIISPARICASLLFVLLATNYTAHSAPTLDEFMKQRGYLPVPVKRGQHNHLRLRAKANGKKVNCIVDTGATTTALELAKAPGLKSAEPEKLMILGAAGPKIETVRDATAEGITLGNYVARNQQVTLMDLNRSRNLSGAWVERTDLILGMDFLRTNHAFISYRGPALYLRKSPPDERLTDAIDRSLKATAFVEVPLHRGLNGLFFVETRINGKPATFMIDTGAVATLVLQSKVQELGLERRRNTGLVLDFAARPSEMGMVVAQTIEIGAYRASDFPIGAMELFRALARDHDKADGKARFAGLLGPELLARASAIIDCAGARLYVLPSK